MIPLWFDSDNKKKNQISESVICGNLWSADQTHVWNYHNWDRHLNETKSVFTWLMLILTFSILKFTAQYPFTNIAQRIGLKNKSMFQMIFPGKFRYYFEKYQSWASSNLEVPNENQIWNFPIFVHLWAFRWLQRS